MSQRTGNYDHNMIEDTEAFLIAEPGAEIELNLTRNFRLALGTSYKFTTPFNVGSAGSTTCQFQCSEGFSFMMTFKFGRF